MESASRYMSVSCRPIGCRSSAPPSAFVDVNNQKEKVVKDNNLKRRQEFYEVFSNMIKLGSSDKQEQKDQKVTYDVIILYESNNNLNVNTIFCNLF